ncbi:MAG: AzlC family ABC transporter permease [Sedimentibacter sp.]
MGEKKKALKAAFPHTIPVMTGYIVLGAAYGILMNSKGYGLIWALLMSLIVYAGSAQYAAITFLTSSFNPVYALFLTLMVNARHIFYGLSLMNKLRDTGKLKPFIIYWLSDETFSVLCAAEPPEGVDKSWFMFFIGVLDYFYWSAGTIIGSMLGNVITFNTKGLDFALTALFVAIFISQWKSQKNHEPAITGVVCTFMCLIIFGQNNFVIPSMIAIILVLTFMRNKIEGETIK